MHTHCRVAHFAFNFCTRCKCGNGIDDNNIQSAATDECFNNFESLFAKFRLRKKKGRCVDAEFSCVCRIERMFRVDNPAPKPGVRHILGQERKRAGVKLRDLARDGWAGFRSFG